MLFRRGARTGRVEAVNEGCNRNLTQVVRGTEV